MATNTAKWPQWLKDAITENADVEITASGRVVWRGGVWCGGVWRGGVWRGGVWCDGEWLGGVWLGGEWLDGVWRGGVWCGGEWLDGVWRDGVWRDGVWRGGEWCGGVWCDGEWLDGVWCDGEWRGGEWLDGEWRDGVWCGGEWRDGVWRDGVWRDVRGDYFDVLLRVPNEVDGLIEALKAGRVNGSCYEGRCACLCGTIANLQHCNYQEIPGLVPDYSRPIERFFLAIRPGHTPENNPWCKQAVIWAEEFKALIAGIRNAEVSSGR